jgi:hypothetical protein
MKRLVFLAIVLFLDPTPGRAEETPLAERGTFRIPKFSFAALPARPQIQRIPEIPRPPAPARPASTIRPRMADSATGYIDNAIVGSQVRIRFDSGFNMDTPDRAEFFYAKCGCYRFLPSNDPAFDPEAPGPGTFGQIEESLYFQELHMELEYQLSQRLSVSADVTARSIQPSVVSRHTGIGDVRVGFKFGVDTSENRYLSLQFRTFIPTGDARRGLGTNHTSVEPAVLYHHRFAGGLSVAGQLGFWHPIGGSSGIPTSSDQRFAGDVLIYGFGASQDVYDGPRLRLSPVAEFVGWRVLKGFQTSTTLPPEADGINIGNLKVGVRVDSAKRSGTGKSSGWSTATHSELW